MTKKNKLDIPVWGWIVIVLLLLLVLNQKGVIEVPFIPGAIETPQQDIIIPETGVSEYSTCLELCEANNFNRGYVGASVSDCIAGDTFITYGYTGQPPLLSCCCFTHIEDETPIGDSDGDGYSDDEEASAGTDPNDPYDYPGVYTCGLNDEYCQGTCPISHPYCYETWTGLYTWACMCTNDAQEVNNDWKPGGSNYYEHDETPEGYITCTDTDGGKDYYTKGHVTGEMEGGYAIDNDDACTSSTRLSEYYCYAVGANFYANWETYNCEIEGKVCEDGACVAIQEYDNCYAACNGIISPEYSAGKLQSDLYFYPYDCQANSQVNCEFSSSLVRWLDYTYYDLDCCCWQCQHWE